MFNEKELQKAYDKNGVEGIENLYYPGDKVNHEKRNSKFPIPEGTGRDNWPNVAKVVVIDRSTYTIGVRKVTKFYFDGIYVGTVTNIRKGICDNIFVTQDGEEFYHWGGPTGYEWYLKNRYWLYGNPPKEKLLSKLGVTY